MRKFARDFIAISAGFGLAAAGSTAQAENLAEAWAKALQVNQGLQAQQYESLAQGFNLKAARSARLPTVRTLNFESFLTASPAIRTNLSGTSTAAGTTANSSGLQGTSSTLGGSGVGATAASTASLPAVIPILGQGQKQLPISITYASIPIYTGGKNTANIEAANQNVSVQRTEEFRTALDLKLTVASAYVGVLRARKNLDVSRSSVSRLTSFTRDARNRGAQGLATRNDVLAAEVSLANARLAEIQSTNDLETAWATYNRYLCRPLNTVVPLDELTQIDPDTNWEELAAAAARTGPSLLTANEGEVVELTGRAIGNRPELAGLAAQARSLGAQANATVAGVKPQVAFTMSYLFLGNNNSVPQGIGAATFIADWTITDGGQSRRKAAALRQQELATIKRRSDSAADVALEVRTRWLNLQLSRRQVPIARFAITQAEENVKVVTDRYRQQLSTYTEVLDAENRRVQSLGNFFNALYDENLALLRLKRAVGDL